MISMATLKAGAMWLAPAAVRSCVYRARVSQREVASLSGLLSLFSRLSGHLVPN